MPVTTFVSHSTKDESADRVLLLNIVRRLQQEPGFNILFDKDNIKASDHWRDKLLAGLGQCNAGLVFLNEKAITSSWVYTEANILRWREWQENVVLVLVLVGPGSKAAFKASNDWKPLAFTEIQFLASGRELTGSEVEAEVMTELIAALKKAGPTGVKTSFEQLRDGIRAQLKAAFANAPDPTRNIDALADKLLSEGPRGVAKLIEDDPYVLEPVPVGNLIEFLAPWWIDPKSSARIAAVDKAGPRLTAYSLNASHVHFTPRMYVQQACCRRPEYAWKIVEVTASGGEGNYLELIVGEVRNGLKQQYQKWWEVRIDEVTDDVINELITDFRDDGAPTFVALPPNVAGDEGVGKAILGTFPRVILFQLTGVNDDPCAIPECYQLRPPLAANEEKNARKTYRKARAGIA